MEKFVSIVSREGRILRDALALRKMVFVEEQQIPEHLDDDGLDATSTHVVVYHGITASALGTGRLSQADDQHGILSRIAVHPNYRGSGIGKRIIQDLEEVARRQALKTLELAPHQYLKAFYQSLGYEIIPDRTGRVAMHELVYMKKTL